MKRINVGKLPSKTPAEVKKLLARKFDGKGVEELPASEVAPTGQAPATGVYHNITRKKAFG